MGWRVLRVTSEHVGTGQALDWLEQALQGADSAGGVACDPVSPQRGSARRGDSR
jgi:hypothetical protein